ncbi:MAG: hypothetical protein U1E92_02580 [Moraxella osloensis]
MAQDISSGKALQKMAAFSKFYSAIHPLIKFLEKSMPHQAVPQYYKKLSTPNVKNWSELNNSNLGMTLSKLPQRTTKTSVILPQFA